MPKGRIGAGRYRIFTVQLDDRFYIWDATVVELVTCRTVGRPGYPRGVDQAPSPAARKNLTHSWTRVDLESVGDAVSELRIQIGSGWRIYFMQRGGDIIILLGGDTKRTQKRDIKRAKELAALLD